MKRSALSAPTLLSLLSGVAALTAGCNDLGPCDNPARARSTVKVGSQVMYTGQAVMLRACATGCHSSKVTGTARLGAPAGLDFDLVPLAPGAAVMGPDGKVSSVAVDPLELAGLRARQRKVFDERESIWEQVDKGLMPPKGVGETFKTLASIVGFTYQPDGKCTKAEALDSPKEELRDWLACGTPIVETVSAQLPFAVPAADAGAADMASGAYAYSGEVGYQYPACSGESTGDDAGVGDGGAGGATFAQVYAILEAQCNFCHSGAAAMGSFDVGLTIDTAYTKLLGADGTGGATVCMAKPKYIVPNKPADSYFLTMVDNKATGRCTKNVMPIGSGVGLPAAELKTITDWINAGAKR